MVLFYLFSLAITTILLTSVTINGIINPYETRYFRLIYPPNRPSIKAYKKIIYAPLQILTQIFGDDIQILVFFIFFVMKITGLAMFSNGVSKFSI
ncbi:MAG: hypothetical protein GF317_16715 [Candidatus Lokiarchaeota archaeon]|nr:hypothetical protein [Candidatus Lokiarchaeota archaeon]MBD3201160.1 hypothetical protein [Candidatus Lokiarchaeota archaeon]